MLMELNAGMMPAKPTLVILAGGRSSRFGSNKALATINDELCWFPLTRAAKLAGWEVVLSGPQQTLAQYGFPVINDPSEFPGPLVALRHLLRELGAARIALVACDMPRVPFSLLQFMWENFPDTVCLEKGGELFPLPALYSYKLLAKLDAAIVCGRRDLRAALESECAVLPEKIWSAYDQSFASLWNMNTPQDYTQLRSFYAENMA